MPHVENQILNGSPVHEASDDSHRKRPVSQQVHTFLPLFILKCLSCIFFNGRNLNLDKVSRLSNVHQVISVGIVLEKTSNKFKSLTLEAP